MSKIKQMQLHKSCQMISFDVKSLTSVPLSNTFDILLRRIYIDKESNTNLTKKELKELIFFCTKDAQLTYNNFMYKQVDFVAMRSLLEPTLALIFIVELESKRTSILTVNRHLNNWYCFVEDAFLFH